MIRQSSPRRQKFRNQPDAPEFAASFSAYVRRRRLKARVIRRVLAQAVGISECYLQRLECIRALPSRNVAQSIGEYFDEPQTALLAAGYLPFPGWGSRD